MDLFIRYVKQRTRVIAVSLLFVCVFAAFFMMYHIPVLAAVYPALICLCVGLIMLIVDFLRIRKKHILLSRIRDMADVIAGTFPVVSGIEDEDYQQVIKLLSKEYTDFETVTSRRYSDMIDYYTVWAHQIKTPIASMRLHIQNEDSELSRKMSSDLLRIEQYVEMVLTFLRLDSDTSDYVIKEYDLDSIIKSAVKKYASDFIERKLKLEYEPVELRVITDEKWLSFVIEQILSNALKYTTSGSITISLKHRNVLSIKDTGMGIAPEDLPRIFDKGYTGYNGRVDSKASGIGLYLCKRICTNLGHVIRAESIVDKGTEVLIEFSQKRLFTE